MKRTFASSTPGPYGGSSKTSVNAPTVSPLENHPGNPFSPTERDNQKGSFTWKELI